MSTTQFQSHNPQTSIAVIGAGITGLTACSLLRREYPSTSITLIAAELPSPDPTTLSVDYTSAWAGAHYRPVPAGSDPKLLFEAELGRRTYEVRKREFAEHGEETGIRFLEGVEYMEDPSEVHLALKDGYEYAGEGDGFRVLGKEELPEGVKWGCRYWTYDVNPDVYCAKLLKEFADNGGKLVTSRLESTEDAFNVVEGATTVVNCSGRGFGDEKVFVTRGQTCLVKNRCERTVTRQNGDGTWTALIPRPGAGTIVGVSKEVGDMTAEARIETREIMLEKAKRLLPGELLKSDNDEWEVVRDIVGRRPTRTGGLRLEAEVAEGGNRIVHAYGVGGRGYELSWAIAEEIVQLVKGE
jgi:glycine/D-amino acid oxidase-like deaminating enzyme